MTPGTFRLGINPCILRLELSTGLLNVCVRSFSKHRIQLPCCVWKCHHCSAQSWLLLTIRFQHPREATNFHQTNKWRKCSAAWTMYAGMRATWILQFLPWSVWFKSKEQHTDIAITWHSRIETGSAWHTYTDMAKWDQSTMSCRRQMCAVQAVH